MNPLWIARIVGVLGLLCAGFTGGFYAARNHYAPIISTMRLESAQQAQIASDVALKATTDNDILKTKLGEQHAQSEAALNVLLNHPAERVLLPATCAAAGNQTDTAGGSSVSTASTERTSDRNQAVFDDATKRLESKAAEWSRALNACQAVMDWAKSNIK